MTGCTLTCSTVEPNWEHSQLKPLVLWEMWMKVWFYFYIFFLLRGWFGVNCTFLRFHTLSSIMSLYFWLSSDRFIEGFLCPCICCVFRHCFLFLRASSELPDLNHHHVGAGRRPHHRHLRLLLLLLLQVWKSQVRCGSTKVLFREASIGVEGKECWKHNGLFFSAGLGWYRLLQRPGRLCSY